MGKIKVLNIDDLDNNQSKVINVEDKEIAVFNPGSTTSTSDKSHFLNNSKFFVSAISISLVSPSFQLLIHEVMYH